MVHMQEFPLHVLGQALLTVKQKEGQGTTSKGLVRVTPAQLAQDLTGAPVVNLWHCRDDMGKRWQPWTWVAPT